MKEQNKLLYKFDEFEIDAANRQLRRNQMPVPLPARAFDLLLALVENRGRLVEKSELFRCVWNEQIVEESNLTVHISQIRKVLGEKSRSPRYIETVSGFGYRFVGEVSSGEENTEIENQRFLPKFSEREVETDSRNLKENISLFRLNGNNLENPPQFPESASRKNGFLKFVSAKKTAIFAILSGCLILIFGVYQFFGGGKVNIPFQKVKLTRLTTNGKTKRVTISPNGKYIAYVLSESEGDSLWIQQVGTASNIRIVPPIKAKVWGLTFTPDGGYVYYNLFASNKSDFELFRIPSLGGAIERISDVSASNVTFSPDGKRFAYIQSDSGGGFNYLLVADANGENKRVIAKKSHPNTFDSQLPVVAWSPDGEIIACLINHFEAGESYSMVVGIDAKDGSERFLSKRRWYDFYNLEWLKNGSGLIFTARETVSGASQIRFLSLTDEAAIPITNELNQYENLSATTDGESFVTIQSNTNSGLLVGEPKTANFQEIISETGGVQPFVWTPNGEIIFQSKADGISNLWKMDANGGNRRQLTTNAQVDSGGLCISPDGKYLVFASWRSGKINLWRVTADGENLTQLTDGEADTQPRCTPDGQSVVFQKGLYSHPTLWKIPIAGGEAVRLTDFSAKWAAVSNDGSRIAYFYMTEDKWRIGIISADGGKMLQGFDVPSDFTESVIHWSPDDQSLFYISEIGNVGNIRSLPLDGSPPSSVTDFKNHSIDNFFWSPDGKRLMISRNSTFQDVILIENVK